MTLRVLVVDDHALVRAGLRSVIAELPGVEVVAEAGDGHEAIRLVHELKPDVAVVDISMPGLSGLEVAERVRNDTRVVIVSMHVDKAFVRRALAAGAVGYLPKHADRAELELAFEALSRGEQWVSPALRANEGEAESGRLTPRQREVLKLIAEGLSTKAIACRLNVSVKTIETHRTELMDRLEIHGVAGLVRYAIRIGLVQG